MDTMTTSEQSVPERAAAVGGDLVVAVVTAVAVTVAALVLGYTIVQLDLFWALSNTTPEQGHVLLERLSGDWLVYGAQLIAAPTMVVTIIAVMLKRARRRQGWL